MRPLQVIRSFVLPEKQLVFRRSWDTLYVVALPRGPCLVEVAAIIGNLAGSDHDGFGGAACSSSSKNKYSFFFYNLLKLIKQLKRNPRKISEFSERIRLISCVICASEP